ncbi:uncharacterized protein LOC106172782 [Lingula anatina]|uniref:Uncharacterized protein LOC106172782 n=1 Tax=Lingula anatina TaxID=7574 RepID=A0A1S3JGW3_LINAN|nr:uncharacterized protein LOC106172782 [Lingula anatina]|eukprot:XP_013409139.1 uncharacterized protein LOC106172782 [Lingula anatina]
MAAARNAVRRIGVLQGALVKRQTYRSSVESRRHQNTYDGRWPPDHGVGIDNVEAQVAQARPDPSATAPLYRELNTASLVNLQTNTLARQGYDMTQSCELTSSSWQVLTRHSSATPGTLVVPRAGITVIAE